MAKLKAVAYKLQKALALKGKYITINQTQIYLEGPGRMCTKYVLKEKREINGKSKNITLFETFHMIDVVNFLVNTFNGGDK